MDPAWLDDDHGGTGFGRGLDTLEQLLTLDDTVILRVDDVEIRSQSRRGLASAIHLFDLEIVAVVRYREQDSRLRHRCALVGLSRMIVQIVPAGG